jgi:ribulose-phosphate 3-epimerase
MPIKIAASLAAAPLIDLVSVLRELEAGGDDMIHFDVEDGSFVPAINLGTKIIQDLRPLTKLPFDVHLMMTNPEWIIPEIARCGANRVSVHAEACQYPRRVLGLIDQYHMRAGLAFNPGTAIPPLEFCQPYLAFVLVLTTEPETSHCDFLPSILAKVAAGKKQAGLAQVEWAVDGGITTDNVRQVVSAGAEVIVSGRGVFEKGRIRDNLQKLKAAINAAVSERNDVSI